MHKWNKGQRRLGWHILAEDGELRYDDGRKPKIGEKLKAKLSPRYKRNGVKITVPTLCRYGMHASPTLYDASQYASGSVKNGIACLVLVEGDVNSRKHEYSGRTSDKFVGESRTILFTGSLKWYTQKYKTKNMYGDVDIDWDAIQNAILKNAGLVTSKK